MGPITDAIGERANCGGYRQTGRCYGRGSGSRGSQPNRQSLGSAISGGAGPDHQVDGRESCGQPRQRGCAAEGNGIERLALEITDAYKQKDVA